MSEEIDIINQYLGELPDPLRQAVISAFQNDFGENVKTIGKRYQLDDDKNDAFLLQTMMTAVGIVYLDELKDVLIAELDISYEQAVRLKHAFEMDVVLPIVQDAEKRGYISED